MGGADFLLYRNLCGSTDITDKGIIWITLRWKSNISRLFRLCYTWNAQLPYPICAMIIPRKCNAYSLRRKRWVSVCAAIHTWFERKTAGWIYLIYVNSKICLNNKILNILFQIEILDDKQKFGIDWLIIELIFRLIMITLKKLKNIKKNLNFILYRFKKY